MSEPCSIEDVIHMALNTIPTEERAEFIGHLFAASVCYRIYGFAADQEGMEDIEQKATAVCEDMENWTSNYVATARAMKG